MSGDLSAYINLEHRGDCSVLLIRDTEYAIGHNISFREDDPNSPRDVVKRYQLSMILYHMPPPLPPEPKRRSQLELGLRRPQ